MNKANECTCPSGDGSLVHPCPAHPAVEQAGGDERAAFERAFTVQEGVCFDDKRGEYRSMNLREIEVTDAQDLNLRLQGWQARAALAQPSPALPPFAEKVLAKLRRFYDCAEDFESGGVDIGRHWLDLLTQLGLLNRVQRSPALWEISQQGEDLLGAPQHFPAQAEADRPEVAEVAFVLRNIGAMDAEDIDGDNVDLRFEDAEGRDTGCDVSIVEYAEKAADLFEQHDRIVGALRADRDSWAEQAEQRLADWDEMRKERDAALARVAALESKLAELEKQESVAWGAFHFGGKRDGKLYTHCETEAQIEAYILDMHRSSDSLTLRKGPLYGAPVAQAQQLHDLDKQCRDDVARALGLRPSQERGFAWSYLLASIKSCVKASEDAAQAQHSVPEGWMLVECGIWTQEQVDEMQKTVTRFRNSEFVDNRALAIAVADAGQCKAPEISLAELLAAAPGKEVPQAWLDVQAERRRQVEVEGYHGFRDNHYISYELSKAARAYIEVSWHALSGGLPCKKPESWPWMAGFKWSDGRTMLVKACALALAEIERLDRAAHGKEGV